MNTTPPSEVRLKTASNSKVVVVVAAAVLTFTRRYDAVLGHRTGSNSSGAEDYLRRKNK